MYPNFSEAFVYQTNWNEAAWSYLNWIKLFHLAQIWIELLPFAENWFGLLEFTEIFLIYGNISNFTQTWMKLFYAFGHIPVYVFLGVNAYF